MIEKGWGIYGAWLISLIGLLTSLYYSEIALIPLCTFCWYQRIALFPLAIQLGIAAYRLDRRFSLYAYPLCAMGALTAFSQIFLSLSTLQKMCGSGAECVKSAPLFWGIPLPWMGAAGFLLIALLLWLSRKRVS